MWARVSRGCGWRAWPRASAGALDVTRRGRGTGHAEDVEALAAGDVPLAILPLGTANNVANSLGADRDMSALLATLRQGRVRRIDLGVACGPWGRRLFVEAAGVGALAEAARVASEAEDKPSGEDGIAFARARLREDLARAKPRPDLRLEPDDEPPFFLELCLLALSGPRLALAPEADPSDGLLDVVRGDGAARDMLAAALRDGADAIPRLDATPSRRARVRLLVPPRDLRVDGEFADASMSEGGAEAAEATIEVLPRALPMLLPRQAPSDDRLSATAR